MLVRFPPHSEILVTQSVTAFAIAALVAVVPSSNLFAQAPAATPAAKPAAPAQAPAAAPAVATESNPEARALLEKARAAAVAAEDLTALVTAKVAGANDSASMKGMVTVVFSKELFPIKAWRFDLKSEKPDDTTAMPSTSGVDGKLYQLLPNEKELIETDLGGMPAFPQDNSFVLLPTWYMSERNGGSLMPGMPQPKVLSEKMGADREVGGVKCRVVELVRETELTGMGDEKVTIKDELTVALGADDSLPRHVLSKLTQSGGGMTESQTFETTYENLKVNTKPADEVFAMKAPEGFKMTAKKIDNQPQMPEMKAKAGDDALDFNLKDMDGKDVTLASLKGKVVLLDFWATWCGPCKQAMPSIQEIHDNFKDKAVAVYGVNIGERSPNAGVEYMKSKSYTYGCLLAGEPLAQGYGISSIPTIIVIDPAGKILYAGVGFGPEEKQQLIDLINGALTASPTKG
jgi:thiol-disulfide isomerase/thioredoxin